MLPVANLKFYSLFWDVRMAKPEFDIKEKIFYNGIEDISIKIQNKDNESNMLYGLMIYDHSDRTNRNSNVTLADSGTLKFSDDKRYLTLTLLDGIRYDEKVSDKRGRLRERDRQMFRIDKFSKEIVMKEMDGYNFSRRDEGRFKSNYKMKNLKQISADEDSLFRERKKKINGLQRQTKTFNFVKARFAYRKKNDKDLIVIDTISGVLSVDSLYNNLKHDRKLFVFEQALRRARENKQIVDNQLRTISTDDKRIIRFQMERHKKFTLSFACFIFFFIGAPLGAIIRKGGLGMPVVVSILFFIVYYIIDTFGQKMAREDLWHVWQGMWLSSFILLPIGIFLTYKSATDSTLLNADAYAIFFKKLFKRNRKDEEEK